LPLKPDLLTTVLLAVLLAAAVTDVRTRRIPNVLSAGGLLLALGIRLVAGDGALVQGLLGAGLALAVALPLFATGGFGGGDAKLLIAMGAFLGPEAFTVGALAAALVGGVMSVMASVRAGVLLPVLLGSRDLLRSGAGLLRGRPMEAAGAGRVHVPYAVAIAIGGAFALAMRGGI
jgi:prepilin peptidase CpaA